MTRFHLKPSDEAIEKLPLLEDIHIHYTTITKEAVEAAGRCCPMLKSFKLNKKAYKIPDFECDDEALAIAGSMPGLRYLQLIGSKITNRCLQAILDKCPHLEYLDLRQCLKLRLEGNMGKLCSDQIKDFRHPNDSTDDYEFATPVLEYTDDNSYWYPDGIDCADPVFSSDDEIHLEEYYW
ncbi:hypothetical protein RJ640_015932 [Escallonia rubra]|uniref:F-box/LRR-repeat protein 15/At3g58940/PEG3-like LRR domain-containing protein n=1 Tax=Escallonia rubra TaxID=112253 RepID=A0AA88R3K7_9ASTE|nr:hypothetical protein RJ640_015932 [Escallonia rubra]